MSQKKNNRQPVKAASFTRRDVRRLFQLGQDDSQSEEARDWLWGFFSDLVSHASCIDYVNDPAIFTRALGEVFSNIESHGAQGRDEYYSKLREVLARTSAGETLEDIYQEQQAERHAREQERLNAPEPKDWLSAEWRHWKIRQLSRAFDGDDREAYTAAWAEYIALLKSLVAEGSFYHVSFALALLPDLITARQDIAQFIGQPRSARRKPEYFSRKGGARK